MATRNLKKAKPVKYKTEYTTYTSQHRMYRTRINLIRIVFSYLNKAQKIFKWDISFDWTDFDTIVLRYKLWAIEHNLAVKVPTKPWLTAECKWLIQEFFFQIYFLYEYDKELTLSTLSIILAESTKTSYETLQEIEDKMKQMLEKMA